MTAASPPGQVRGPHHCHGVGALAGQVKLGVEAPALGLRTRTDKRMAATEARAFAVVPPAKVDVTTSRQRLPSASSWGPRRLTPFWLANTTQSKAVSAPPGYCAAPLTTGAYNPDTPAARPQRLLEFAKNQRSLPAAGRTSNELHLQGAAKKRRNCRMSLR